MYEILLELFGYPGTALVIASMMMTSLGLLRIFNISGSLISAIYSAIIGAWPVFLMNVALIVINVIQLLRARPSGCGTPCGAVDGRPNEYDADFAAS